MLGLLSQTDLTTTSGSSTSGAALVAPLLIGLAFVAVFIVAYWRIFTKIGEPGWKSLIPIYNTYVIFTRAGKEGLLVLLFFVPCVNIVAAWLLADSLGDLFRKSTGFKIGLFLLSPIFILMLAFGNAEYAGGVPQPAGPGV